MRGLDLLHILEPTLHSSTVDAIVRMTPSHDGSVLQNGSKSAVTTGAYLLDSLQLSLYSSTVATRASVTPGHNGSIVQDGSKSATRGLNLNRVAAQKIRESPFCTLFLDQRTSFQDRSR